MIGYIMDLFHMSAMSDHRQREAIASLLLDHINKSDVLNVESCLKQVHDNCQWRDIVRHEFPIQGKKIQWHVIKGYTAIILRETKFVFIIHGPKILMITYISI